MKIDVHNLKGGSGKTCLSINLAAAYAQQGHNVMLIDNDPQASSLAFSRIASKAGNELPFVVTNSYSKGFDIYITDHAPGPVDAYTGNVVVVPTLLDAQSFIVYRRAAQMAEQLGMRVVPVGQRYRYDRLEQRQIHSQLSAPTLRDRAIYPNSYSKGQTVFDSKAAFAVRAQDEINAVLTAINNN